jgi:voltage-gated potassium channel
MPRRPTLRRRLYEQLDPRARERPGLSPLNRAIVAAILLSVLTAVLDSEPEVAAGREALFSRIELVLGSLFVVEYLARLWTAAESPRYGPGLRGRLRYVLSAAALLDLVALTPVIFTAIGAEAYVLRLFRLVRVLRLARLGEFSDAMALLAKAVHSRRHELTLSVAIAILLLLATSTLLYIVEGEAQPESFGSIPRAMWWSIVTLTTVGYGDVYPRTVAGKMLAGITAVTGIGLIAMPTGILAAAFSEAMRHRRLEDEARGEPAEPKRD